MSSTQSNDSLRELNAKLLAEIGELRKKFAEIKVENADKNAEIPDLRRISKSIISKFRNFTVHL